MGRKLKKAKPLIYVFCEGESEQAYTDFLKKEFSDVAVIKRPSSTGLFDEAKDRFSKDPKFRNSAEETDEIWFFFDVEVKDSNFASGCSRALSCEKICPMGISTLSSILKMNR